MSKSWGEYFWRQKLKGLDPSMAAHLADEWEKRRFTKITGSISEYLKHAKPDPEQRDISKDD